MRVFKNAWFSRFARKQKISDGSLIEAIERADQGLIDANLGSGVIKQRVAREGRGKSGGYRTIIFYRSGDKAFFMFGFAKSDQSNLDQHEEVQFRKAAAHVLTLSDEQIDKLIENGQFSEVNENG
jgi:hypothetical protein